MNFARPETETKLFAVEYSAIGARHIREAMLRIDKTAMQQVLDTTLEKVANSQNEDDRKLHDEIRGKARVENLFEQAIPSAERLTEIYELIQLPFFDLTKKRQRLEIHGDMERALSLYLMAHPGLAAASMVINFSELKMRLLGTRSKRGRLMRQVTDAYRTHLDNDPAMSLENPGWNDWHYTRYCLLGTREDLEEIVRRYAGILQPADNPQREMIVMTCRWMVNSLRESRTWFRLDFDEAWKEAGHTAALPLNPITDGGHHFPVSEPPERGSIQ